MAEQSSIESSKDTLYTCVFCTSCKRCKMCSTEERKVTCAKCSEQILVENFNVFDKGQHIAMPGSIACCGRLYQHHAIVVDVETQQSENDVNLTLVELTKPAGRCKMNIEEIKQSYTKEEDKIYLVKYKHCTNKPEDIVHQAKSVCEAFKGPACYNVCCNNCEHIATDIVVGKKESLQVQKCRDIICNDKSFLISSKIVSNFADEIVAVCAPGTDAPSYTLTGVIVLYFLACIVISILDIRQHRKKYMCCSCLKSQLIKLWVVFGIFFFTSLGTFCLQHYYLKVANWQTFLVIVSILIPSIILQFIFQICQACCAQCTNKNQASQSSSEEMRTVQAAPETHTGANMKDQVPASVIDEDPV